MLKQITTSNNLAIDIELVKNFCKVDLVEEDQLLQLIVRAVTRATENALGMQLLTSTHRLTLDKFPCDYIELPIPPLQRVESLEYIDCDGNQHELAEDEDFVVTGQSDTGSSDNSLVFTYDVGRIYPAYGKHFPSTRVFPESVIVTFTAGFGDDDASIPDELTAMMLQWCDHLYRNRSAVIAGQTSKEIEFGCKMILGQWRQFAI